MGECEDHPRSAEGKICVQYMELRVYWIFGIIKPVINLHNIYSGDPQEDLL